MTGMRALALVAVLLSAAPPIDSPGALRDLEAKVRDVAPRVRDAVVAIVVEPTPGKDGAEQGGTGSGTLISADGWVLTAGHVGQAPGRAVSVLLADGTELKGITAGQHFGPHIQEQRSNSQDQLRVLPDRCTNAGDFTCFFLQGRQR